MPRTEALWYSEPSPALREADEDQVVRWIGGWLMDAAPEGWRQVDLTVRLTSMVEEISPVVVMADGGTRPLEAPADVSSLLFELRQKKYMRGRGTWLSLRMLLESTGDYGITYNFDQDPLWDPPVGADVYTHDLETFPRDDEWVPAWYRQRMNAEATAADLRTPDEPDALLQGVLNYLRFALPPGWDHLHLEYGEETTATVTSRDGVTRPWTPPEQVIDLVRRHREVSGTWQRLTYELRFPKTVATRFE
jgi:hypothetical protein